MANGNSGNGVGTGFDPGDRPPGMPDETTSGMSQWQTSVEVRLSELRAAISGLRHSQNLTLVAVVGFGSLLGAFSIGFSIYTWQKIDNLPSEFHAITQGITQAITATRNVDRRSSQQPVIIQMPPTPQTVPTPTEPKPKQ